MMRQKLRYVKWVLPCGSRVVCECRACTSTSLSANGLGRQGHSHPPHSVQPERSRRPRENPSRPQCAKDAPAGRDVQASHAAISAPHHPGEGRDPVGRTLMRCPTRPATGPRPPPGRGGKEQATGCPFPHTGMVPLYRGDLRYVKPVCHVGAGLFAGCRTCTSTSLSANGLGRQSHSHPPHSVQPERSRRPRENPSRPQCAKDAPAGRDVQASHAAISTPHHPGEGRDPVGRTLRRCPTRPATGPRPPPGRSGKEQATGCPFPKPAWFPSPCRGTVYTGRIVDSCLFL